MEGARRPHRLPVPFLLALALSIAVRIAFLLALRDSSLSEFRFADSLAYHRRALGILGGDLIGTEPPFYASTLYPYLLATIYAAFGVGATAVRLCQAAVGIVGIVVLRELVRREVGEREGEVAGILAALYAPLPFFEANLLAISTTATALVAALLLAARVRRGIAGAGAAFGSGLLFSLAVADKPNLLVVPLVVTVGWWVALRRRALRPALAAAAALLLVLLPLLVRNRLATGEPVLFSASTGFNLAVGHHPGARGTFEEPWSADREATSTLADLPDASRRIASRAAGKELSPLEADRHWKREAVRFATGNVGAELRLLGRKGLLLANRVEVPNALGFDWHLERFPVLRALPIRFGVLFPFGVVGLVILLRRSAAAAAPLLALVVLYGGSLLLLFVSDRFRVPMLPALFAGAATVVVSAADALREKDRRALAIGAVAVLALGAVSALPIVHPDRSRDAWVAAEAAVAAGRPDEAIAEYRRALALRPDAAEIATNYGRLLATTGRLAEAERVLRKVVRDAPFLSRPHSVLARILVDQSRFDEAAAEFRRAAEIDPGDEASWLGAAAMLERLGRPAEVRETFLRAASRDPRNPRYREMLASLPPAK